MLSGKRLIVRAIEFANVKPTPNMYSTPGSRMPSTPAPSSVSARAATPPMAIDDVPKPMSLPIPSRATIRLFT